MTELKPCPFCGGYDEEKDCYCVKECWYEVNVVDDNPNWIIDSDYDVTHWMPLPMPPKED